MAFIPNTESQIFCQTVTKTITNTVAKTSALGSGVGNKIIKTDDIVPGRRIRLHGEGVYSSPLLLGSLVVRIELGGTVVASVTTSALGVSSLVNAADKAFTFDALIVFRATGTSGKVIVGGAIAYSTLNGTKVWDDIDNAGAETTINTTQDLSIDITAQWDSASTSRAVKTTIATIMLV